MYPPFQSVLKRRASDRSLSFADRGKSGLHRAGDPFVKAGRRTAIVRDGKCHRKQTARKGYGEMAVQETTGERRDPPRRANPLRSKIE